MSKSSMRVTVELVKAELALECFERAFKEAESILDSYLTGDLLNEIRKPLQEARKEFDKWKELTEAGDKT